MALKRWKVTVVDGAPMPEEAIAEAARILDGGGIVAFPTETVYGLAVRADHPAARERLLSVKGRDPAKPLTLHVPSAIHALDAVDRLPPRVLPLVRRFWPGPLTLVLPARGGGTVGVRVPAHAIAQQLLERTGAPVLGTSANRSGDEALSDADAVAELFADSIDALLDAGPTTLKQASTVVKVTDQGFAVLREGIVTADMVRGRLTTRVLFVCTGNSCRSPMAEALFKRRLAALFGVGVPMLAAWGFEVASAGTSAGHGASAAPQGVEVMRERGLDIARHSSRPLDRAMIERATVVVALSPSHRQTMLEWWPDQKDKVILLDEAGVPDPIGGPLDLYRICADHIEGQLRVVIDHLFGDALGRAALARLKPRPAVAQASA